MLRPFTVIQRCHRFQLYDHVEKFFKMMLNLWLVVVITLSLVVHEIHLASAIDHTIKNTSYLLKLTPNPLIPPVQFTNCYIKKKEIDNFLYSITSKYLQKSINLSNNQNLQTSSEASFAQLVHKNSLSVLTHQRFPLMTTLI